MRRIILACAFAGVLGVPAFGQGVDPILGTWILNIEKSSSTGLPKSWSLTFTEEGQNLIDTAEGVDAQGQSRHVVFRHTYDGQPHPTTGTPLEDSSAYTRVGNTINMVSFRNGKAIAVSQIGNVTDKTYTITVEGITPNGSSYRTTLVWDKQ